MAKTILITGATDGIGLSTAKQLAAQGHKVLLHGRNAGKLTSITSEIGGSSEAFVADLSSLDEVESMATRIRARTERLDVLINNAGVLKTDRKEASQGLDLRFVVNAIAPYLLTRRLLPIIAKDGRVVNVASAAQARVDLDALAGRPVLDDMDAYAQSKLALVIWSQALAREMPDGPVIVCVNPGSLLGSKMVRDGFGIDGGDLSIGADILCRAALDPDFEGASGRYFDNDAKRFGPPHAAAADVGHVDDFMSRLGVAARVRQP